jgi:hypothetical protein
LFQQTSSHTSPLSSLSLSLFVFSFSFLFFFGLFFQ